MSHTWPLLIGLAITGLLSVPTMNAQEVVGPLPVKTVIRGGAEVSDFRLFPISPNGKYVAYTLSENEFGHRTKDLWANYCRSGVLAWAGRSILRLHNLSTGADVPLTPAGSHDWAPTWSPDGRSLAFYSDREGGLARIWIHDMASGKERKVSDERVLFSGGLIQWTPDASRIVVKTYPRSLTTEACIALESSAFVEDASPTKSDGLTVRVYSSEVAKSGEGRADAWRLESNFFGDLAVIDVAHGGVQRISYPGPGIGLYKLSPDGSLVAFSAPKRFEKASSQQILFDV